MNFLRCLAALLLGASLAAAGSPALTGILPRGAQRGTQAVFVFTGARIGDVKEVVFYRPGLRVTRTEALNVNQVRVTAQVAPDCPLGEHGVRLRTGSGLTELRTFWVGPFPTVEEKEPNSDFAKPQKISLGVTVEGVIDNEDVDYYAVELKKGQRLSVEIEALRLAATLFDPYVAILDAKRFELATSDDHPLLGQDGMCSIVAPADGTYVVQVRDSAYQGNGECRYRLHVGSFPRPQAVVPAGGKAGEEVEVRFLGDPAGEFRKKVKLPATPGAPFGVVPEDARGPAPSAMPFRVSAVGNVIETEPNDAFATATKAELPLALNGVIDKAGDVDFFRFKAKAGQTFDVHCWARRLGSPLDSVMTLFNARGDGLVSNDDSGGPDSYFRYTFPADGDYYLRVTDHLGKGGPTYFYRVEFTPVVPAATLSIPKVALYSQERQVISVPRGGRMASLVTIARANFGGPLLLSADALPPGIALKAEPVAANLDTVPMVFEAGPGAALSSRLVDLRVRHADPKHAPVASKFLETTELVQGPNQSVMWRHLADRLAVAVCDEAYFTIDVIEPKAPLVQNGTMQLRVVAKRAPSFKGPINVYPLWSPPGVSAASAATIPAGASETTLTINAAGNAEVKKWKTAVLGMADNGTGPLWTSSQLFTLEVAAPFVAVTMERAAVEQGKATELFCKLTQVTPFSGKAKVRLLGLPFKVTTAEAEVTPATKEISFKLATDKASPAGIHRNLFCQIALTHNGEPVVASSGYSELRIDVPIVKAAPPPAPVKPVAQAPPPKVVAPPKRLTRLEMLRKEQEEREKAGGSSPRK